MARKALIVWGGWDGNQHKQVGQIFDRILKESGFETEVSDTLDAFKDEQKLLGLSLIVPVWTMGKITNEQANPVFNAVKSGVGIAGCHGGMCDSFRENTEWQFMTGGQWVAHPGNEGATYTVYMDGVKSPLTDGIADFEVTTEQYYMHVDPGNTVLATTHFGDIVMPVVWTKHWGQGRVFYCSLGHRPEIVNLPPMLEIMTRGMLWAAEKD